jgi:hypothetical protein
MMLAAPRETTWRRNSLTTFLQCKNSNLIFKSSKRRITHTGFIWLRHQKDNKKPKKKETGKDWIR